MAGSYSLNQCNAILRYHYKIVPEELPDDEYAKLWNEWLYINELKKQERSLIEN